MAEERVERFTVWSSRIIGIIGLVGVAVALAFGVPGIGQAYDPVVYPICGLVGVVLWTMLLRPAAAVVGDRLVLRNPLSTLSIPLAAIEQVAVRQFLAVRVGDRRYANASVGRSRRQGLRDDQKGDELTDLSYGGLVEHRIGRLAEEARTLQGIALYSDEQEALAADVRREPAWVEIGLLAGLALALVVTLFL